MVWCTAADAAEKNWLYGPINAVLYRRRRGKRRGHCTEEILLWQSRFQWLSLELLLNWRFKGFQIEVLDFSQNRNWNMLSECLLAEFSFLKKVSWLVSYLLLMPIGREWKTEKEGKASPKRTFYPLMRSKASRDFTYVPSLSFIDMMLSPQPQCDNWFWHYYYHLRSTEKKAPTSSLCCSPVLDGLWRSERPLGFYVSLAVALKMVANLLLLGVVIWLLGTCCLGTNDKALTKEKERSRLGSSSSIDFPLFSITLKDCFAFHMWKKSRLWTRAQ